MSQSSTRIINCVASYLPRLFVSYIALALLLAPCLAQPAWGDFWEGFAAYQNGDYATALRELKPLAEQGHGDAQYRLGYMYYEGNGVPQNYKEAAYWWRKAAEQGDPFAQNNLGCMYGRGEGVPQNYKEAAYWYRKAAVQGDDAAQYNLGMLFVIGEGVPQNFVTAHMWLNLSASQGHKEARKSRDKIATKMPPQQIAEAQRLASEWKPTKEP